MYSCHRTAAIGNLIGNSTLLFISDLHISLKIYLFLFLFGTHLSLLPFYRLGGRFTIRPQNSQQQLQMHSSFSSGNNKFLPMSDSNRNFNNAGSGVDGASDGKSGGSIRGNSMETVERPLMQKRTTSTRSIGTVSFRNVANGSGGAGGGNTRGSATARSSFRFAGGGILRHSSSPASSSHSARKSQSSSFWRMHGGNPNLMDR